MEKIRSEIIQSTKDESELFMILYYKGQPIRTVVGYIMATRTLGIEDAKDFIKDSSMLKDQFGYLLGEGNWEYEFASEIRKEDFSFITDLPDSRKRVPEAVQIVLEKYEEKYNSLKESDPELLLLGLCSIIKEHCPYDDVAQVILDNLKINSEFKLSPHSKQGYVWDMGEDGYESRKTWLNNFRDSYVTILEDS